MFKHLLVPLDGSQLAETALPYARELATRFDSRITLLQVVRGPHISASLGGDAYADVLLVLREQNLGDTTGYLKTVQSRLIQDGFQTEMRVIEGEAVAEAIVEMASEQGVDTIVMSTHGRGGLSRWVFGSVADKVMRLADMPVLLIRGQEKPAEWHAPDALGS